MISRLSGDACIGDLVERPAWQRGAACRGKGTSRFFPSPSDSLTAAKVLCAGCTAREACLTMAIADASLQGVWGGTSERERRQIRRKRRAADLALPRTLPAPRRISA